MFGLERGYCLMFGGDDEAVQQLEPVFAALALRMAQPERQDRRHAATCMSGPVGAGHFVKMVHNGIEYGLMQAFAEGFNILHKVGADSGRRQVVDAETAPVQRADAMASTSSSIRSPSYGATAVS